MTKNIKQNSSSIYAIFSIAVVLYILIIYLIISFHSSMTSDYLKEQISFVVEINKNASSTDIDKIKSKINSHEFVHKAKTEFISKEEAFKMMNQEIDIEAITTIENPFSPLLVFYINAISYHQDNIDEIKSAVETMDYVNGFYYSQNYLDGILKTIGKIRWFLLGFLAIMTLLTLFIIFSTIKIKLQENRFKIKTMELVGAEQKTINGIFQKDAFAISIKSIGLAVLLLVLTFGMIYLNYTEIMQYISIKWVILSVLVTGIICIFVIWLTTKVQVNQYLSKHFYELY